MVEYAALVRVVLPRDVDAGLLVEPPRCSPRSFAAFWASSRTTSCELCPVEEDAAGLGQAATRSAAHRYTPCFRNAAGARARASAPWTRSSAGKHGHYRTRISAQARGEISQVPPRRLRGGGGHRCRLILRRCRPTMGGLRGALPRSPAKRLRRCELAVASRPTSLWPVPERSSSQLSERWP